MALINYISLHRRDIGIDGNFRYVILAVAILLIVLFLYLLCFSKPRARGSSIFRLNPMNRISNRENTANNEAPSERRPIITTLSSNPTSNQYQEAPPAYNPERGNNTIVLVPAIDQLIPPPTYPSYPPPAYKKGNVSKRSQQ